jgi:hypothetical protein
MKNSKTQNGQKVMASKDGFKRKNAFKKYKNVNLDDTPNLTFVYAHSMVVDLGIIIVLFLLLAAITG